MWLNSTVPGSFAYMPTNGTILDAGTNILSVIFTPADTTDYNSITGTVSLVIQKAPLSVTPNAFIRPFGQSNPVFTGVIAGLVNSDPVTSTYASGTTSKASTGARSSPLPGGGEHQIHHASVHVRQHVPLKAKEPALAGLAKPGALFPQ